MDQKKYQKTCVAFIGQSMADEIQLAMFSMGFRWFYDEPGTVRQVQQFDFKHGYITVDDLYRIRYSRTQPEGYSVVPAALVIADGALAQEHKRRKNKTNKRNRVERNKASQRLAVEIALCPPVRRESMLEQMMQDIAGGIGKEVARVYADPAANPDANPKHALGAASLPMTMVSPLFRALVALGKQNGALKYGGANYIGTHVVMSTYLNAIQRHFDKILMGEDCDPVDGVPHWGAIGANIDIIVSAAAAGTLIDDRLRADGQLEAYMALTPMVKALSALHAGKEPKHYYMKEAAQ